MQELITSSFHENPIVIPIGTPIWYHFKRGLLVESVITGWNYVRWMKDNPDATCWVYSHKPNIMTKTFKENNEFKWKEVPEDITMNRGTVFYDCDIPIGHSGTIDSDPYDEFFSSIQIARMMWNSRPREDRIVNRRSRMRPHKKFIQDYGRAIEWIYGSHNQEKWGKITPEIKEAARKAVTKELTRTRKFIKL